MAPIEITSSQNIIGDLLRLHLQNKDHTSKIILYYNIV